MGSEAEKESAKSTSSVAALSTKKTKRAATRKAKPVEPAKRKYAKAAKAKLPAKTAAKPAAKLTAPRKHSTPARRARIIATADREGLTAVQVQKRFGVKPITYYSWRKASKKAGPSAVPTMRGSLEALDIAGQVRQAVRDQIFRALPEIVRNEIETALSSRTTARRGRRATG